MSWNPFTDGQEVACYLYENAEADPLYEVVRFELSEGHPNYPSKTFLQRRYEPAHPKADVRGFVWGLAEVEPVLYHLPRVRRAVEVGQEVYIAEGEKDVHILEAWGLTATCRSGGVGRWEPRYTAELRGTSVVVLPDNDEPGRAYAEAIARDLHAAGVIVRVVAFPGLPPKGDVTDWKESGGTLEELEELIYATEPWKPTPRSQEEEPGKTGGPRSGLTQAGRLIDLVADAELFHTPQGETYVSYRSEAHTETLSLHGVGSLRWLRVLYFERYGSPPSAQALQDAKAHLAAVAELRGPERPVYLRVAEHAGQIYIDLGGPDWSAVEVSAGGWCLVASPPVRFRRVQAMGTLPEPVRGGSLDLVARHIPLPSSYSRALLYAWCVQALRPRGPYPLLVVTGEQGSGKSTACRLIRALIDPSAIPIRAQPGSERDLIVAARGNWLLAYDNLSRLSPSLSDAFCRLATGGGFGTRRLYTNDEEAVFFEMHPQLLNGITDLMGRPDLADRAIVLDLAAMPESERRTEADVWEAFRQDHGLLFGALLDAMATALAFEDAVELDRLPRMADFARWAVAAEPAFPTQPGTFLAAYEEARAETVARAVEADTVATAIYAMLEGQAAWTGTVSELGEALRAYLPDPKRLPRDYPQSPHALAARLRRLEPVLRSLGIERVTLPRSDRKGSRAFRLQHLSRTEGEELVRNVSRNGWREF